MFAYTIRRLLLMIPTLFGILLLNFLIVQLAPGGPVEQVIARIQGMDTSATQRFSGGGTDTGIQSQQQQMAMMQMAGQMQQGAPGPSGPNGA